jgi:hypothetical protein
MAGPRSFWLWVLLGSTLITAVCYGPVIGFGLTDKDTLMHITEARIQGPGDVLDLLSKKLAGGRAPLDANFYRPTVMLTFAGLRGLFGWSAPGYHVFDLALHAANGWLLALFAATCAVRTGLPAARRFGVLCGALFLLHPVGVEVVPAIARNGDLLLTAGLLSSLLAFDRALEWQAHGGRVLTPGGVARFGAFALLFTLTLGAKEPGIVGLGAPLVYAVCVRRDASAIRRGARAILALLPCALITVVYLAVRARVLGEALGGYHLDHSPWLMGLSVANGMALDLTIPGFTHVLPGPLSGLRLAFALALAILGAMGLAFRRAVPIGRLLAFACGLCLAFAALFIATGVYDRRLLYAATAFWSFVPALAVQSVIGIAIATPRRSRGLKAAAGLAVAVGTAVFLWQSPLVHRYDEWRNSGEAAHALTEAIRGVWSRVPPGSTVMLLNMPSSFALDPMRQVAGADISSTNALAPNGVKAWLDDQFPGNDIQVRAMGYHVYREPMAEFRHRSVIANRWLLYRVPDGENDLDEALETRFPQFKKVTFNRRRNRLAWRRRPIRDDVYVLVVDGTRPALFRASQLDGTPSPDHDSEAEASRESRRG